MTTCNRPRAGPGPARIRNSSRLIAGFSLAELLIVVAIISVLTAIAIPIFTNQLEQSREATDISNVRAAVEELYMEYLTYGPVELPEGFDPSNPDLSLMDHIPIPGYDIDVSSAEAYHTIVLAKQTKPDWQGTPGKIVYRLNGVENVVEFDAAKSPGYYLIEIPSDGRVRIWSQSIST